MALSNAERQRRHRERVKQRLEGQLETLAADLRKKCSEEAADGGRSLEGQVVVALDGYGADKFAPLILAALGLPADPWPGLTREELARMTKGRLPQAKMRGAVGRHRNNGELTALEKLRAARQREWLQSDERRAIIVNFKF